MARYYQWVLMSTLAMGVSGCGLVVPGHDQVTLRGEGIKKQRAFANMDGVYEAMKDEPFDVRLVRYADGRLASNEVPLTIDEIIYEYNNDNLLQGVNVRLPGLMQSHFAFGVRNEQYYTVEMKLKHLRNYIRTGTMLTTRFGSYVSEVEVDMLVRDMDSTVLLNETYASEFVTKRDPVGGRHPSKDQDRKAMRTNLDEALKRIAYRTVWDVRNKHYELNPTQSARMAPDTADASLEEKDDVNRALSGDASGIMQPE